MSLDGDVVAGALAVGVDADQVAGGAIVGLLDSLARACSSDCVSAPWREWPLPVSRERDEEEPHDSIFPSRMRMWRGAALAISFSWVTIMSVMPRFF